MAFNSHQPMSSGDSTRHQKQARAAKKLAGESNKINKKYGTRHTAETADGEITSKMDASEDDNDDDHDGNGDEEDVHALSGAQALDARQRLAGLQIEDMFVHDETPAVASTIADEDADNESIGDDPSSDSDPEDEAMNRAVERDLIEEFESREHKRDVVKLFSNPGANIFGGGSYGGDHDLGNFDLFGDPNRFGTLDMNIDPYDGLTYESNEWHQMMLEAEGAMSTRDRDISIPTARKNSSDSADTKKRVRFMEPQDTLSRSSSMSSSEEVDPSAMFPDLLEAAAAAVANGNRESLANGVYEDFDDAVSCYDFDGDEDALDLDDDESTCDEADASSDDCR